MMNFICHNFEDKTDQDGLRLTSRGEEWIKFQRWKLTTSYPVETVRFTLTKVRIQYLNCKM